MTNEVRNQTATQMNFDYSKLKQSKPQMPREAIKQCLKEKRYSINSIAQAANVSWGTIQRIKNEMIDNGELSDD
ncbi:hypothetical protein C4G51_RS18580 [Vibrio parahaemolyticus]|nr:hypothetical protein [Vibrio parahaemolyticus]HCG9159507.1 hypothetical protein [Vibrio parahaemolyticus]